MNKSIYIKQLQDYRETINDFSIDHILCPICFRKLKNTEEDLEFQTRGHVWPKYLRKLGKKSSQIVIICKECNNRSGQFGENMWQNYEKIKHYDSSLPRDYLINLEFADDEFDKWIKKIKNRTLNSKERPPISLRTTWKRTGITTINTSRINSKTIPYSILNSAYLYAFYLLGYKYILNDILGDFVRYLIYASYKTKPEMVYSDTEFFSIKVFPKPKSPSPYASLVIPVEKESQYVSLNVHYLQYQIQLPILLNKEKFVMFKNSLIKARILKNGKNYLEFSDEDIHQKNLCLVRSLLGNDLLGTEAG